MSAPPFTITSRVLSLSVDIGELLGRLRGMSADAPQPKLRRANRIKTVRATTAIEGNRLSEMQVTALLDGKRVVGPAGEIREVENAIRAYESTSEWDPWSEKDLLHAHRILLGGLLPDAGKWRSGAVGVLQGSKVAHVAPPARRVPGLMAELLEWGAKDPTPELIKACVVHYEIQFIHPFSDGNGRVGRLWQHLVLRQMNHLFEFVPVESMVHNQQKVYYAALGASDRSGSCTPFIEFALTATRASLRQLVEEVRPERETATGRLDAAREAFNGRWFRRSDYLNLHKRVSAATASRDLSEGVDSGLLLRRGDRRTAEYAFHPRRS